MKIKPFDRLSFHCAVRVSAVQALRSKSFLLSALSFYVIITGSVILEVYSYTLDGGILSSKRYFDILARTISSESVIFFSPILASLVMAGVYVDDLKTGYIKFFIMRVTRKSYIFARIIGCFLAGALVLSLGMFAAIFLSTVIAACIDKTSTILCVGAYNMKQLLILLLFYFITGGLWSVTGLVCSAIMESRVIAYCSPFIVFYFLIILNERFFPAFYIISPKEWLNSSIYWNSESMYTVIVILVILITLITTFRLLAMRRLKQL